jgi:hypothetical protein
MREICTSGSMGGEGGNILTYPAAHRHALGLARAQPNLRHRAIGLHPCYELRLFRRLAARALARRLSRCASARFSRHLSHLQPRRVMTLR